MIRDGVVHQKEKKLWGLQFEKLNLVRINYSTFRMWFTLMFFFLFFRKIIFCWALEKRWERMRFVPPKNLKRSFSIQVESSSGLIIQRERERENLKRNKRKMQIKTFLIMSHCSLIKFKRLFLYLATIDDGTSKRVIITYKLQLFEVCVLLSCLNCFVHFSYWGKYNQRVYLDIIENTVAK